MPSRLIAGMLGNPGVSLQDAGTSGELQDMAQLAAAGAVELELAPNADVRERLGPIEQTLGFRVAAAAPDPMERFSRRSKMPPEGDERRRVGRTFRPIFDEFGVKIVAAISQDRHPEALKLVNLLQVEYAEGGVEVAEVVDSSRVAISDIT